MEYVCKSLTRLMKSSGLSSMRQRSNFKVKEQMIAHWPCRAELNEASSTCQIFPGMYVRFLLCTGRTGRWATQVATPS